MKHVRKLLALCVCIGALGIVGTLLSDMLLVVMDPRIRFEKQGARG